jgi:choline dehydrogenase-like flavoprotein
VKLVAEGDMLPHPDNRVALSTTQRDRHGDPVPVVTLRTSAFEEATIARGHEAGRRVLSHLRPRALWTDQGVFLAHFLGTTAMGTDPGTAVCDGIGRCHELDNLYIAGSSLFPTSGAAHPTLLIAALAIRTGEHLARSV